MKITKKQFKVLERYYEVKIGVESIKKSLANLEYWAQEHKEIMIQLNAAHKILTEMEFEP